MELVSILLQEMATKPGGVFGGVSILYGAKNGKLIFFEGKWISFDQGLSNTEGRLTPDLKLKIDSLSELTYLFDIPILEVLQKNIRSVLSR